MTEVSAAAVQSDMRSFLEENFLYMHPGVELSDQDNFLTLGIIDSLGFVELVEEVQSRYGLQIEDVEITEENFGSIDAIARFVAAKQSS
jgi:acyl carrier protein